MSNFLKRFLFYFFGYLMIFGSISSTGIRLKWWQVALIIIGVTIVGFGNEMLPVEKDDNFK